MSLGDFLKAIKLYCPLTISIHFSTFSGDFGSFQEIAYFCRIFDDFRQFLTILECSELFFLNKRAQAFEFENFELCQWLFHWNNIKE